MTVRTRHINSNANAGITFSAKINDDLIEVRHCDLPVGTQIEIKISQKFSKYLESIKLDSVRRFGFFLNGEEGGDRHLEQFPGSLGDYYGDHPSYLIKVNNMLIHIDSASILSPPPGPSMKNWNEINLGKTTLRWTHGANMPALAVNNFLISLNDVVLNTGDYWRISPSYLATPKISILDSMGTFPLDMRRREVAAAAPPYERELVIDITRKFALQTVRRILEAGLPRDNNAHSILIREFNGWHLRRSGLLPGLPVLFREAGVRVCYAVMSRQHRLDQISKSLDSLGTYSVWPGNLRSEKRLIEERISEFFGRDDFSSFCGFRISKLKKLAPKTMFFSKKSGEKAIRSVLDPLKSIVRNCAFEAWITDTRTSAENDALSRLIAHFGAIHLDEEYYINQISIDHETYSPTIEEQWFADAWLECVGSAELPLDRDRLEELLGRWSRGGWAR
ncbi:hypothetical protein ACTTAL_19145 (plasmid) [Rhodobacter capsulatus]